MMLDYKKYIYRLIIVLSIIFSSVLVYSYFYSKYYPIPLTSRISLDAKLQFIRDLPDREKIDTIIMGSSIGLNNINGPILEESSMQITRLLNMSAFSMEVSHMEQILPLLEYFPHLKRVIYSAQSLDFTGGSSFEHPNIPLLKGYIALGKNGTNLKYTLLAYKSFINIVKRQWTWEKKHLAHNKFENLDYDYTGSAGLEIYGDDIIKRRWTNPFVMHTNKKSYTALERIIKRLHQKGIDFYFVIEPYRDPLVKKDKKLRKILDDFNTKAKRVVLKNNAHFINLYRKLHLEDKYFADRIHLNDTGNVIIAKEISKWVDAIERKKRKNSE